MLEYQRTEKCRMEYLLNQLDDPHAAPCGRCDNCSGPRWNAEVSGEAVARARERLRRPGVDVEQRRMWPSGMGALDVPLSGKLGAGELAEPGRVLGRLTDVGWGNRLRELFARDVVDRPVPDDVVDGCVAVLASWGWAERPVGVVAMGSVTRPNLVSSLAERISTIGRLPLVGEIDVRDAGARQANSARRLAQVWRALTVGPALADQISTVDGPLLLVDDRVDTGWTMTVAAKLLRDAGAPAVLPLALATTN
jgi:ATP-dependent DNA helicase RecQ